MTEQLKRCPFCGGKVKFDEYRAFSLDSSFNAICCDDCGLYMDREMKTDAEAASAWNSRPSPWVPVSERLPEHGQQVIALDGEYPPANEDVGGATFEDGKFWVDGPMGDYPLPIDGVTHWMPIPPAPETKGE